MINREKLDRAPAPGEIIDGQFVGVPTWYRVTHVRHLAAAERAGRHLAVDCGAKRARKALARLNAIVRRLAAEAAKLGGYVSVHMGGLSGRPDAYTIGRGEISCSVWITVENRIVRDLVLWASAAYVSYSPTKLGRTLDPWARQSWKRIDVTMRRLAKISKA